MRSRRGLRILVVPLALSLAMAVSGCSGLFGGQSQPNPNPMNVDLGFSEQCLSDVLGVMERFTVGTASPDEVSGIWNCFASAVTLFEKKVVGSQQDGFTGREVASFFEDRFLNGLTISDPLLQQVMAFKQIAVGGSATVITKSELLQLAQFAHQMNTISLQLLPYMKVFSLNWQPTPTDDFQKNVEYFEAASDELQNAAQQLTGIITANGQPYDLRGLSVLFAQLEQLEGQNWSWVTTFQADFPLVEKIKLALAGGDPDVVKATEWNQFGTLTARGFIQVLRYHYFVSESNQTGPQFVYFANSLSDLFNFLGDMVASKPTAALTTTEIMDLLNTINTIFPQVNFTSEFLTQVMNLKVVLFGGSATQFVQADFKNAQSKVSIFRSAAERVWEYLPFYFFTWNSKDLPEAQAQQYFTAAEQNMQDLAGLVGNNLSADYDLQNLSSLADALTQVIVNPADQFKWAASLKNDVPALIAAKNLFLGDTSTTITQAQWTPFLGAASDILHRSLYYLYFLKNRSVMSGPGLDSADIFEKQVLSSLTTYVQAQAKNTPASPVVPMSTLLSLGSGLGTAGILGNGITTAAIQPMLQSLFGRLLMDPNVRLAGGISTGMSQDNITRLDVEYQIWSGNQHLLESNQALNSAAGQNQAALQKWLSAQGSSQGVKELQLVMTGSPALIFNAQNRLMFSSTTTQYDFNSVANANLARQLARLIINGYITDATRLSSGTGLISSEFQTTYTDFKPFAVDLGLISPSNTTFAASRFFEANIFTPIGNGDSYLSLGETTQIIEMIISGLNISSQMKTLTGDTCTVRYVTNGVDSPDDELNVPCVTQVYDVNIGPVFQQAPELVAYFSGISSADRQSIVSQYLTAAGWHNTGNNLASRADISLIPYVFQYAEALLQRYDLSHQGALNYQDALVAWPNFSNLIASESHININVINEGAFLYILTHEAVSTDFFTILPYIFDAWFGCPVTIDLDRKLLATTLAAIVGSIGSGVTATAPATMMPPTGMAFPFMTNSSSTSGH